jgi:DNA-binding beta-propeller fold protein YncE
MDGATNNVTYVTPFGGEELSGSAPVGIAVNPTTNRIYFAGTPRGDDAPIVVVVDGATLQMIRSYPHPTRVDPDRT